MVICRGGSSVSDHEAEGNGESSGEENKAETGGKSEGLVTEAAGKSSGGGGVIGAEESTPAEKVGQSRDEPVVDAMDVAEDQVHVEVGAA